MLHCASERRTLNAERHRGRVVLVHEQHRAWRAADELFCIATIGDTPEPLVAVRGNHQHVDLQVFRRLDNFFARYSGAKLGAAISISLSDLSSKGLENAFGIVTMPLYRRISWKTPQNRLWFSKLKVFCAKEGHGSPRSAERAS